MGSSEMAKLMSFNTPNVFALIAGTDTTGMVTVGTIPAVSITTVWYGQGKGYPQIIPGDSRSGLWQIVSSGRLIVNTSLSSLYRFSPNQHHNFIASKASSLSQLFKTLTWPSRIVVFIRYLCKPPWNCRRSRVTFASHKTFGLDWKWSRVIHGLALFSALKAHCLRKMPVYTRLSHPFVRASRSRRLGELRMDRPSRWSLNLPSGPDKIRTCTSLRYFPKTRSWLGGSGMKAIAIAFTCPCFALRLPITPRDPVPDRLRRASHYVRLFMMIPPMLRRVLCEFPPGAAF